MKSIFLILVTFFTFNICFASFPVNNISDHLHNQEMFMSDHEIIESSNDLTLLIVVVALIGLIIWLFSKSSKTADPDQKRRLNNTASILSAGLMTFLVIFAIAAIVFSVLFFQWLNSLT